MMNNNKDKPAYEKRLNQIRVTVWENQSESGPWFNTVITRRYMEGTVHKEANTFNGLADLALVAEAVALARDFIRQQEDEANQ